MKFKVDENLPIEVVRMLEDNGHDALTVLDQNLGGALDSRIAQVCKEEKRALITLRYQQIRIRIAEAVSQDAYDIAAADMMSSLSQVSIK
jgi:hypothetical protein